MKQRFARKKWRALPNLEDPPLFLDVIIYCMYEDFGIVLEQGVTSMIMYIPFCASASPAAAQARTIFEIVTSKIRFGGFNAGSLLCVISSRPLNANCISVCENVPNSVV